MLAKLNNSETIYGFNKIWDWVWQTHTAAMLFQLHFDIFCRAVFMEFFELLDIDTQFLQIPIEEWEENLAFMSACNNVKIIELSMTALKELSICLIFFKLLKTNRDIKMIYKL